MPVTMASVQPHLTGIPSKSLTKVALSCSGEATPFLGVLGGLEPKRSVFYILGEST